MEQAAVIFGVVMLVALVVLPILRPQLSLVSWILMFPLEQLLQGAYSWFITNSLFVNAAIAFSIGLAAVRMVAFGGMRISNLVNFGSASILIILLYALLSVLWSANQALALEFLGDRGPYLLIALLILPLTVRDLAALNEVRWWVLVLGAILALALYGAGTFRFYGQRMVVMLGGNTRGNPLALAELGGTMFVLGVMSRDARGILVPSLIRVTATVLGAGLILSSGSRGQLIAAMIASGLCFPFAAPLKNPRTAFATAIGLGVVAVVLWISLGLFVQEENVRRWSIDSLALGSQDRLAFVARYLEVWLQSPIAWVFGLGTLSFQELGGGLADFVENLAVEILFEEGVPMFLLFVTIWIVLVRRIVASISHAPDDIKHRAALMTWFAICIFFLAVALKSYCVWSAYPLWLWLAIAFRVVTDARSEDAFDSSIAEGRS
jgi:hypothetical protein